LGQAALKLEIPRMSLYTALRYDPTRTTGLRDTFARDIAGRFRRLRGVIRKAIVDQDCFGLKQVNRGGLVFQVSFDFPRSADKVSAFMDWLKGQESLEILQVSRFPQLGIASEGAWTDLYVESAYQTGIARARDEMVAAGYPVPSLADTGGVAAAFNTSVHADRAGLIFTRVFEDLKGITAAMDTQISRVLSQGMLDGKGPAELARLLTRTISGPVGDLGITDTLGRFIPAERRAKMLARTEVIRAHHLATIQEYRNWGLAGVRVMAEWSTAGFNVCPECEDMAMNGPYTLDYIESLIPLHPNCRCMALPIDVTDKEN